MAQADEDKIKAALTNEVEEATPAEPADETPESPPVDNEPEAPESDKPAEDNDSSFTKPQGYEWVKGDSLEEFNTNLLTAYENSTAEALRLRQAAQAPPAAPADTPAVDPAITYAQSMMQKDMVESFNEFAKKYPQAREPQSFDQFEKASQGAALAFSSAYGRVPTYPELFEKTAQLLDWQTSDKNAQRDAAIKNAGSSTATSGPAAAAKKAGTVPARTLEIARRIPGNQDKSNEELAKELQPYIT